MIGNIKLYYKVKENNFVREKEFLSKDIKVASLDGLNPITMNHFSMKSVFKEFKHRLSLEDKTVISEMLMFIDSNKGNIKSASVVFVNDSGKCKLNIDLMKEKKDMLMFLYTFEIKTFSNGSYIFVANFFLGLISFVAILLTNYERTFLGKDFEPILTTLILAFVFIYSLILPIPVMISLAKNKIKSGIMYFDNKFITRWITAPLLFFMIGFLMSLSFEFSLSYLFDYNLKVLSGNSFDYTVYIVPVFAMFLYIFLTEKLFKIYKRKYSDPFIV